MSNYIIQGQTLTDIADAIRAKSGSSANIMAADMADAITNLPSGEVPTIQVSSNMDYAFAHNMGQDLIRLINLGKINIITTGIISLNSCFYLNYNTDYSKIIINCAPNRATSTELIILSKTFYFSHMTEGNEPTIICPQTSCFGKMDGMFYDCDQLKSISDFTSYNENWDYIHNDTANNASYTSFVDMFRACYRLKTIDKNLLKRIYTKSPYANKLNSMFNSCYCLEKIEDLGFFHPDATINKFDLTSTYYNPFKQLCSLKSLTFDAKGAVRNYSNVKIDLSQEVGYTATPIYKTTWNMTGGDSVATSVYNHDSAVETITSLPDCSAVSSPSAPTNIIYFKTGAGAETEGGNISDLTAEEIAIATNKGWSVQFKS